MHNSTLVGLDKPYMRKLRIAMDPNNSKKVRERAKARIRREIAPMLEVAKLHTEVCSKAGRLSPTDQFFIKKRITEIIRQERKSAETVGTGPDMCEAATIGGTYGL